MEPLRSIQGNRRERGKAIGRKKRRMVLGKSEEVRTVFGRTEKYLLALVRCVSGVKN